MKKISLTLQQHKTSISLEPEFWAHVVRIASEKNMSHNAFIANVDRVRGESNLSSALRLVVLKDLEKRILENE